MHLATGLDAASVLAVARLGGMAVAAAVVMALLLNRRSSGLVGLAWALLLIAVLHPTTQPWYLTWGLLLMAAATAGERNRGLVVGCSAAAFVVLPVGPQLGLVLLENSTFVSLLVALAGMGMLTLSPQTESRTQVRKGLVSETISVIVPTRNERENVEPLIAAVVAATGQLRSNGRRIEMLFVDDSDDGTADQIRRRGRAAPIDVEVLHRDPEERWGGLGGAVVDGFASARGRIAVVIDGDLQHPPSIIPRLVAQCDGGSQLSVASRRISGGSEGTGLSPLRRRLSILLGGSVRLLFPVRVRRVADPLSGCFAVALDGLDLARLQPDGFKILVEVLATHPASLRGRVSVCVPGSRGRRLQGDMAAGDHAGRPPRRSPTANVASVGRDRSRGTDQVRCAGARLIWPGGAGRRPRSQREFRCGRGVRPQQSDDRAGAVRTWRAPQR